jgi:hypothetical protein
MLREHEAGKSVSDLCREHGISQPTFYGWKSRYGGMQASEMKELKDLRTQVQPLGEDVHRVADGPGSAQGHPRGKVVGPDAKRDLVHRLVLPIGPNITWSMDFMSDALVSGRKYRTFNVIDDNREALKITIDTSLPAQRVIRELGATDRLARQTGAPAHGQRPGPRSFIRGIAQVLQEWASANGITFIYPAGQTHAERLDRTLQQDLSHRSAGCLDLRASEPSAGDHPRVDVALQS